MPMPSGTVVTTSSVLDAHIHVHILPLSSTRLAFSLPAYFLSSFLATRLNNQAVLLGRELGVPHTIMASWYYGASGSKKY